MALKKPTATENKAFEADPETAGADTAVVEAPAKEKPKADEAAAKVQATAAVATAQATSSAVVSKEDTIANAKAFKKEVEEMQGAADFSYGTHRVFKAKDGTIKEMKGDKTDLGRWVKVRLLAWDKHFEVSPGEDSESSSGFVAYSKDGITIDSVIGEEQKEWAGKPVADYVEYLKSEEDFEKAGRREFLDTEVAVLDSEEEKDFKEVIQITLSSSSMPAFKKYQSDLESRAKCVAMGLPGFALPQDPFTFFFIREAAEKGKNTWTKLKIASVLPAKI